MPGIVLRLSGAQIAAEKKRKAEEAAARESAESERRAAEDAEDREAARQRAAELCADVAYHREGLPAPPPHAHPCACCCCICMDSKCCGKTSARGIAESFKCCGTCYRHLLLYMSARFQQAKRSYFRVFPVMSAGAVSSLEREGKLAWFTEPKEAVPGQRVKLFYNAQSGSLSHMAPLPSPPTLVLGYNGWLDTQASVLPS